MKNKERKEHSDLIEKRGKKKESEVPAFWLWSERLTLDSSSCAYVGDQSNAPHVLEAF